MNTTHTAPKFGDRPQLNGREITPTATPCPLCARANMRTVGRETPRLNTLPGDEYGFCHSHGYVDTPLLITCVACELPTHPTRMASDADFRLIHPAYAATARPGTCSDCALGLPAGWRP